jgi:predicted RNase H-like HicB family nuclease
LNKLYPMSYRLTAVIEKDSDGYYAYCPELKGCQSQGDTFEETQANIQEAIELYLESLSDIDGFVGFRRTALNVQNWLRLESPTA